MTSINIIGTGNVAWHIAKALQGAKGYTLKAVAGRSKKHLADFKSLTTQTSRIEDLPPATITMIIVTDDAIQKVMSIIPYTSGLFIHTSGSVPLEVLSEYKNHGVFYPLQSFSKEVAVYFKEVPICVESNTEQNTALLKELGFALSEKVTEASSPQRQKLHLAAIYANNFVNHCVAIAHEICDENDLSFNLLRPLLKTTLEKAMHHHPAQVQTGPAKRDDQEIIKTHIAQISNPMHREVYKVLSQAITTYYGKEL